MASTSDPKKRMENFLKKYDGKTVKFEKLSQYEKYSFVLVDSFDYFRKSFGTQAAMNRAIRNADSHKKNSFVGYPKKSMKIVPETAKTERDYKEYVWYYYIISNRRKCLGKYITYGFSEKEAKENCRRDVREATGRNPNWLTLEKPKKHPAGGIVFNKVHYPNYDPKTQILE